MASLAGDNLPAVREQRPRPALAWAASSAAPTPRQPSTSRMVRGRPNLIRRPLGLRLPGVSATWTDGDLPYMRRPATGQETLPEHRPGNGTSVHPTAEMYTAPELLGVELASREAMNDPPSDTSRTPTSPRSPWSPPVK
ncbi:unnamed protein product [Prorocentrum cordatum]|uniref:Uncharacterized protein n=1 Tax=Prorocentrum cordatum TaxID=2364126 RepID=A0ABN9QJS1_9DINO|nr:unnamed protein product [Polarella glacialis]